MWQTIAAVLGGGFAMHLVHKHRSAKAGPKKPALKLSPRALGLPPPRPPVNPQEAGKLTPQRAAIHGELMVGCHCPQKLARAAHLFGAEGLPNHAEALMTKANLVNQMKQGAASIVERCRAGDQHTMAIAKAIGEQARKGDQRAKLSEWLITEYIKANPPQSTQTAA